VDILKIYDFTIKDRELGRMVFALSLDKKRLAERIIIGNATRKQLNEDLATLKNGLRYFQAVFFAFTIFLHTHILSIAVQTK
jgi:hypothetical protein